MERRDLTINTFMRSAKDGRLAYCEGAWEDLKNGIVRHYRYHLTEEKSEEVSAADLFMATGIAYGPAYREPLELAHKMWLAEASKENALPQVIAALIKSSKKVLTKS